MSNSRSVDTVLVMALVVAGGGVHWGPELRDAAADGWASVRTVLATFPRGHEGPMLRTNTHLAEASERHAEPPPDREVENFGHGRTSRDEWRVPPIDPRPPEPRRLFHRHDRMFVDAHWHGGPPPEIVIIPPPPCDGPLERLPGTVFDETWGASRNSEWPR